MTTARLQRLGVVAAFALAGCGVRALPASPARVTPPADTIALLLERAPVAAKRTYRIAPGDTLAIRVDRVKELTGTFRVSATGTVVLPLAGEVAVGGRTAAEAAGAVGDALHDFVVQPQVTLWVSEFTGERVCVVGAVRTPGVYPLHGVDERIADLLTEAGGLTDAAGPTIWLAPARQDGAPDAPAEAMAKLGENVGPEFVRGRPDAVAIDVTRLWSGGDVPELDVPVRGGDVIVAPPAGQVYVDGWVNTPGGYRLGRAMTVSDAVAHAGGLAFAASAHALRLKRQGAGGNVDTYRIDWPEITAGRAPDPLLDTGDRIEVGASAVKVVPWAVWRTIAAVFRIGVGGPVEIAGTH